MPAAERAEVIGLVHHLRHTYQLSIREIATMLLAGYDLRRSAGTVHTWLTTWRCVECSGEATERSGGAT
jgi:hypothetical protein